MADQTFWYSSLEALMMQSFVVGFTYLTTHKQQVQWLLKTWHCIESKMQVCINKRKGKLITGNMVLTLEGSKWWSETTLSKVYKNAVFDPFWDIKLGNNGGIMPIKISIRIQENFHNHVPIFKSHHNSLPGITIVT